LNQGLTLKNLYPLLAVAVVFLTVSCMFIVPNVKAIDSTTENSWATMAPMPTARSGLGVGVVDGKIYAIGGGYSVNEMYDPSTNIWVTKQSMPNPNRLCAAVPCNGKIYCIGGLDYSQPQGYYGLLSTNSNEVYDVASDSWSTLKPMPTARDSLTANLVNGKIYLIGGRSGLTAVTPINVTEIYDIATNNWSTGKQIPTPVAGYASAVIDDKIFIIGGFNLKILDYVNSTQIYDPASDSWSNGAPAPNLNYGGFAAAATTGIFAPKKIYVIGGGGTQIYDPANDSWSSGSGNPNARGEAGVGVVDDMIYIVGGAGWNMYEPPVNLTDRYTPLGYSSVPISSSSNENAPSSTAVLIAGVAVATAIIAVTIVIVYHFKHEHKPAKPA
jgi:hypothetical protein